MLKTYLFSGYPINRKPRRSGAGIAFLCGGGALLCKRFHQCLVILASKSSVLVNGVIAYRKAIGRGFHVYRSRADKIPYCNC